MTNYRTNFSRTAFHKSIIAMIVATAAAAACNSTPEFPDDGEPTEDGDGDGTGDGDGDGDTIGDGDFGIGGQGGQNGSGDGDGPVCETASSETELAPIFLAFAFDVSGSMGHYDHPNWWHDPEAKWLPVRQATQAFFEDASSSGISASMGLFPAQTAKCEAETYGAPEVTMKELPSTAFASAFDAYEAEVGDPLAGGAWRGGTPTLAAFSGTSDYLDQFRTADPTAKVAVVMVTDGLPQGCSSQANDIGSITTAVGNLYEGGSGVRTYVIGIENPTAAPAELPAYDGWNNWGCGAGNSSPCDPPDTLSALNGVAAAGGTTEAFLIDTGDPEATKANFRAAIDAIRTQAVSCELSIPPHPIPGRAFDKDKIDVSYTVDSASTRLDYDPTCQESGTWRYADDEASLIELCPDTCDLIRSTPGADLNVDFLCEIRPDVVK